MMRDDRDAEPDEPLRRRQPPAQLVAAGLGRSGARCPRSRRSLSNSRRRAGRGNAGGARTSSSSPSSVKMRSTPSVSAAVPARSTSTARTPAAWAPATSVSGESPTKSAFPAGHRSRRSANSTMRRVGLLGAHLGGHDDLVHESAEAHLGEHASQRHVPVRDDRGPDALQPQPAQRRRGVRVRAKPQRRRAAPRRGRPRRARRPREAAREARPRSACEASSSAAGSVPSWWWAL